MEIKIIKNEKGFLSIQKEWEVLQSKAKDITYYSTFHFLYHWFANIADKGNTELCIICVYEKNEVIGIAPLMTEKRNHFFLTQSYYVL